MADITMVVLERLLQMILSACFLTPSEGLSTRGQTERDRGLKYLFWRGL